MKGDKAIQEAIKTLRLTIAINELLPPDLQCKRFIARMKVQLARLQRKPDLKLVTTTNPKPVGGGPLSRQEAIMKKFKTVAGYLRSMGEKIHVARVEPGSDAERAHERQIINSLLPQLGITTTIAENEKPRDGVTRLLQSTQDERQAKALQDCHKWLGRVKFISASVVTQVTTAQGLVSYHVNGFRRGDTKSRVSMIVDADEDNIVTRSPHAIAEEIAGPEYCFHACSNINHLVPDSAKNRLFTSDEDLYAAVPQLKPRDLRRAAR